MSDDTDATKGKAGKPKPPKIKAEDNPWYLLATLYGEPEEDDEELKRRNRIAWNRYFAANLDEKMRARLIEEKRHSAEELAPFLPEEPEELQQVREAFAKRSRDTEENLSLPASDDFINFSNVQFDRDVNFEGYLFNLCSFDAIFSGRANFKSATFSVYGYFENATFSGCATFEKAIFFEGANFESAIFSDEVYFVGVTFFGPTDFETATFSWASFQHATFFKGVNFDGATFSRVAIFVGAIFPRAALFGETKFKGARFERATFSGPAMFQNAIFSGKAVFTDVIFEAASVFVNAKITGMTSFDHATFKMEPPRFFGAKLHQRTTWRDISWPKNPKDKEDAGRFIDAYACLKLEMDRLKKHEDELNFFTLELQSRGVEQGPLLGFPIAIYGLLCDYGRSYFRPLAWFFGAAMLGASAFKHFGGVAFVDAFGLSLANMLSVFGFRKDFNVSIDDLPVALKFLAALQTILGTILLFLFGLGVRNKFRMK